MAHDHEYFTDLYEDESKDNDRYDIYVNKDYVGQKMLFSQKEHITDLEEFLKEQGINQFYTELIDDHFHLRTDDEEQSNMMKDVLGVYLQSR